MSEAMTDSMDVFDRKLLRKRRDAAATRGGDADFLFREVADRVHDRLMDVNRSFEKVLNVGGHAGYLTEALGRRDGVSLLVQTDLSQGYARQAKAHAPSVVCDDEWLPFGEEAFDLVVSSMSLHWVNDLPGVLIQANRALRPDGLFQAAMLGGETLWELRECLMQAELDVSSGVSPRVSPFAELRDLGGLMQRAGFALPVVDSDLITVTYDNMFKLLADLRAMGETNMVLAQARGVPSRRIFMRAAELYQDRHADAQGRIPATFQVIYLHGWAPDESQQKPLRPGAAKTRLADALGTEEYSAGDSVVKPTAAADPSDNPDDQSQGS